MGQVWAEYYQWQNEHQYPDTVSVLTNKQRGT